MPRAVDNSWGLVKPPPGTPLDDGGPFRQGLRRAYLFNEGGGARLIDYCTLQPATPTGVTPTNWIAGPGGPGFKFINTTQWFGCGVIQDLQTWTVASRMRFTATGVSQDMFGKTDGTSGFHLQLTSGNKVFMRTLAGGAPFDLSSNASIVAGVWYTLVWTRSSAGTGDIWINNSRDIAGLALTAPGANGSIAFNINNVSSNFRTQAVFDTAYVWNYQLPQQLIRQLVVEPYAPFQGPEESVMYGIASTPASTFQAAWASQRSRVIGVGVS